MASQWVGLGRVERFVQAIVVGGLALVAGLWLLDLFALGSPAWIGGVALVVLGIAGLSWGIYSELSI